MKMKEKEEILEILKKTKESTFKLMEISSKEKNKILYSLADALDKNKSFIMKENQKDIEEARRRNLSSAFVDRLTLTDKRIEGMKNSLLNLVELNDPMGEIIKEWTNFVGLKIKKVRVPIGVILIIYESRPDVTSDCIGLCIKSSNAVILKGGSEALNSNLAIFKIFSKVLEDFNYPKFAVNIISTKGLIKKVTSLSRIPVIKHYKGICHIYVDEYADLEMAKKVCFNAKVQRPATCNAMESLLVNKNIAEKFLPLMLKEFITAGVQIRGCPKTLSLAKKFGLLNKEMFRKATEKDYYTEYLDLILSVKIVNNLEEAIEHINKYGLSGQKNF